MSMADAAKIAEPTTIANVALTVTRGVTAGWIAGIPQVLVAQAGGRLLGIRERADIGPRFVRRAAEYAGRPLSTPMHWLLAGVFHFEYAALWGAGCGRGWRRACVSGSTTRSSSARGPTGSRRPLRWRRPGAPCWCWRPRARPAGACARSR